LITAYLDLRHNKSEPFLQTYRRLGLSPFKAVLYPEATGTERPHAA